MILPLNLPSGVWKNGTEYQAKGKWFETDKVRWHDGALRAIGGWAVRTYLGTPFASVNEAGEKHRDIYAWRTNDKDSIIVSGGAVSVKWIKADATYVNITPVGLPPGAENPSAAYGYGTGLYGLETYGTRRSSEGGAATPVGRWDFHTWGEELLAYPDWPTDPADATIYKWEPAVDATLLKIDEAPDGIVDFVVTDQLMVMTIGDPQEARLVQWSDSEDYRDWDYNDPNNLAGRFVLQGSGSLTGMYNVGKQVLILSETDAHVGRYIGPPYVYGFDRVGDDCAPIGYRAVLTTNNFAVWIGDRNAWIYDGQVRELPCPIIDFLVADHQPSLLSKIITWVNPGFTEAWWHYCSNDVDPINGEPDKYFMWNWETDDWAHGTLDRTAMHGNGTMDNPMGYDHDGIPNWHELSTVYPVGSVYAKTGPLEIGDGQNNMAISQIFPDIETPDDQEEGQARFQFESRQMPTGPKILSPEYQLGNPTSTRVLGRQISMIVTGQAAGWEYGNLRINVAPSGTGSR